MIVNFILPLTLVAGCALGIGLSFEHIKQTGDPGFIGPVIAGFSAFVFSFIWQYLRRKDEKTRRVGT